MDLIIAIKEERAFICNIPVKENHEEIMTRLEDEGAMSAREVFSFKQGSTVIDDDNNLHTVVSINAPMSARSPLDWFYTDENGETHGVIDIKGTLIKEVPKYHIEGLLS